jgi:hypothetical protein
LLVKYDISCGGQFLESVGSRDVLGGEHRLTRRGIPPKAALASWRRIEHVVD